MWQLCVLVTALVHSGGVVGQGLVFPGSSDSPSLSCTITRTGQKGECKLFEDCPALISPVDEILIDLQVCGVSFGQPQFCCPSSAERLTGAKREKLKRKTVTVPRNEPNCGILRPDFKGRISFDYADDPEEDNSLSKKRKRSLEAPPYRHFEPPPEDWIVGGRNARESRHPWMALLGKRQQGSAVLTFHCGGSLINNRWVLTAAHCLNVGRPDVVRLGEHNYNDTQERFNHTDYTVADVVVHPGYQEDGTFSSYHDLALIKVTEVIKFREGVLPICLPWGAEARRNLYNKTVTITGWGAKVYGGDGSPILQEASVTVFPSEVCDASYSQLPFYSTKWPRGIAEDTFLCAGNSSGGIDTCQGDSGGPLVYSPTNKHDYTQVGVVSTGYGCGLENFPGLYVPLSNPDYLRWIKKVAFGED